MKQDTEKKDEVSIMCEAVEHPAFNKHAQDFAEKLSHHAGRVSGQMPEKHIDDVVQFMALAAGKEEDPNWHKMKILSEMAGLLMLLHGLIASTCESKGEYMAISSLMKAIWGSMNSYYLNDGPDEPIH